MKTSQTATEHKLFSEGSVKPYVYKTNFVRELSVRYCCHLFRWTDTELLRFNSLVTLISRINYVAIIITLGTI